MELLGDKDLERSSVVANCWMNRERSLTGSNGYAKELGFNPLDVLAEKGNVKVAWLDLCCGSGKALIEAAQKGETIRNPPVGSGFQTPVKRPVEGRLTQRSQELLGAYRRGEPVGEECPLKRALGGQALNSQVRGGSLRKRKAGRNNRLGGFHGIEVTQACTIPAHLIYKGLHRASIPPHSITYAGIWSSEPR
jgi:hypothetical protein